MTHPQVSLRASVVIPAHNEGAVIGRCLKALSQQTDLTLVEVVVVANGCTDDTVAQAERWADVLPLLTVLDLADPSKTEALNAGEDLCTAFPRIYLDADITLGTHALERLITDLTTEQPRVASPRVRFDVNASDALVRAYYAVFALLPYSTDSTIGLGVYGMSGAGRVRFGRFPPVLADDLLVQRLFDKEQSVISDATFDVRAPRDLVSLLAVRTRVARGNRELLEGAAFDLTREQSSSTTSGTARALLVLLRRSPSTAPAVAVYAAVTIASRMRARVSHTAWHRDDSSRMPVDIEGRM